MSYSIRRGTPPNTRTVMRLTTQDTVTQARALIEGGDHEFRIFNSRGEPVKLTDLERVLESMQSRSGSPRTSNAVDGRLANKS